MDLKALFPADQFEMLQVAVPVPRIVFDGMDAKQRSDLQLRAAEAVADVLRMTTVARNQDEG